MTDPMAVQWFGESWGAPVCDPEQKIDIPVEEKCARCGLDFASPSFDLPSGSQGFAVPFIDVWVREISRPTEREDHELGIWPGSYLYFHRTCFMAAIR